jgi:hypothetical protein
MLKAILAAAVLVTAGSPCFAQWGASSAPTRVEAAASPSATGSAIAERNEPPITVGQIARLKAALKLRAEQLAHWAPVEAGLSELARDRSSTSQRVTKLRRLKAMAAPLVRSLDDAQRGEAVSFARRLGYGQLADAF